MPPNRKSNERYVKLHGRLYERNKSYFRSEWHEVPWLNVSGKWLAEAGFSVGDPIRIAVSEGRLVITLREKGVAPPVFLTTPKKLPG